MIPGGKYKIFLRGILREEIVVFVARLVFVVNAKLISFQKMLQIIYQPQRNLMPTYFDILMKVSNLGFQLRYPKLVQLCLGVPNNQLTKTLFQQITFYPNNLLFQNHFSLLKIFSRALQSTGLCQQDVKDPPSSLSIRKLCKRQEFMIVRTFCFDSNDAHFNFVFL